ncbi:ABC transporter ATP-binding protein [Brevundimonas faecalis]
MASENHSPGLVVRGLGKKYPQSNRPVFEDISFNLERDGRLAILGRNGQGKSTLIKILGGVLKQSAGCIKWDMTSSWPIGFGGGFQGSLTGLDNIRFLARIYKKDYHEIIELVDEFAELGPALKKPVKQYSAGMRARLAFGLSLAIEFDCYLVDELVAVGDARFQRKCQEELFERRAHRAFLMASHDLAMIKQNCDRALIVEAGRAKMFADIEEAVDIYSWLRS